MPIVKEPHDSNYEYVEEEDKGSRAGSTISSMGFVGLKTMIKSGLNELLGASLMYLFHNHHQHDYS